MINAQVIEASRSAAGKTIYTLQLKYHRFIHGELLTHRVFSRNSMSSRAVPVKKMLAQVWSDPAMPVHWGANQPGMQAKAQLKGWRLRAARALWRGAAKTMCVFVWGLDKLGLHKQVANRLLEPWQWMHTVLTSTEWSNFYGLRCHTDAQPEFQRLAYAIQTAIEGSETRDLKALTGLGEDDHNNWHLPYVLDEERIQYPLADLLKFSAARCARVSYLLHDGSVTNPAKDIKLFMDLVGGIPLHASPIEHQARQAEFTYQTSNNFRGWDQHRELYELAQQDSWISDAELSSLLADAETV